MIWLIIAVAVLMLVLGFELFLVLGVPVYLVWRAKGGAPRESSAG